MTDSEPEVLGLDAPAGGDPISVSEPADDPAINPAIKPAINDDIIVADDLHRTRLFGLDMVNAPSLDPVIEEILHGPRRDDVIQPVVLTPNVDIVVHLEEYPDSVEANMFRNAQYCLPDGQPLVMFSRIVGERLQARLPGSGLFEDLWPRIIAESVPVVAVVSSDDIAASLTDEYPKTAFVVPPMFDADDDVAIAHIVTDVLASARACRPSLILVGIGNPKDARIIAALFDRWDHSVGQKPLALGLGGSFAMYLGYKKRAPDWIQRIGMEWFYRFLQEPRRLFHRYFVRDAAFLGIMRREWRQSRRSA